jgi:hypothetical protein
LLERSLFLAPGRKRANRTDDELHPAESREPRSEN